MTLLLNAALPLMLLVIAIATVMFAKGSNNRIITAIKGISCAAALIVVYGAIQPSYMPKGKAPAMAKVPIEYSDSVIQDRLLKPISAEDSQQKVDNMLTVRQEAKKILSENSDKN